MDIKNGIKKLLHKEYLLFQKIQSNSQYATTPEGYSAMEEWINDVDIFNQKYLKDNPLHKHSNKRIGIKIVFPRVIINYNIFISLQKTFL